MKVALAIFAFMLIMSSGAYAQYFYDFGVGPASGTQYSPGGLYAMNVQSESGAIEYNFSFESNLSTLNETLQNITPMITPSVIHVDFTDLPAGTYVYRWIAYEVGNESNSNASEQLVYTVSKNSSNLLHLYLNGVEGDSSYAINGIANFTAFLNLTNKTIFLGSNYTGFIMQVGQSIIYNLTNLSTLGAYSLVANWQGDSNYSGSSRTYYFDNLPPQYSERLENPSGAATYAPSRYYTFNIRWTDTSMSQAWFESNHTGTLRNYTINTTPNVQNNSNYFFIAFSDLPAETFVYRWIANDSLNQISNTSQVSYHIWKAPPLTLQITPSRNVTNGTQTSVRCLSLAASEVPTSIFKMYRDSTLIDNDTLYSRKDERILSEGTYNYVCNNTETQNFTNQTIRDNITVGVGSQNNQNTPATGTINLIGPPSIQTRAGWVHETDFFLQNNYGYPINVLSLDITGIDASWYKKPDIASEVPNNFSLNLRVTINPPSIVQGDYSMNLRVVVKLPSNETRALLKSTDLKITSSQPEPDRTNSPPVYSTNSVNSTFYGDDAEFSLRWNDDAGLSGYIFSSNITGLWMNDSLAEFSGTESISQAYKSISVVPGSALAWKFYAVDSNNVWTESEEFILVVEKKKEAGGDILPLLMLTVFVVLLAVLIVYIANKRKPKGKTEKKDNVVYVYKQDDLKQG